MIGDRQPDLPIFQASPGDSNVAWFARELREACGWLTAAQVSVRSGGRLDDRQVRALAEAAAPDVISGQRRYKHVIHATPEEIHHFVSAMGSQAKKMITRAEAVRRRAHELVG